MKVEELLSRAETAMEEYPPNLDFAKKLYTKALSLEPDNLSVLDAAGEFFCEFDDPHEALAVFRKSAELAPNANPRKFFYLGQLTQGREALAMFRHGIALASELRDPENQARVASALCGVGELFMTDLCDEASAQSECLEALQEAVRLAPKCVEALNGLATFFKVVGRMQEAEDLCRRAMDQLGAEVPVPVRVAFAKTLIDLEKPTEALAVLHSLLEEDEEDVEIWFLVACAHLVAEDFDAVDETIQYAREICEREPQEAKMWKPQLDELEQAAKQQQQQQ